MSTASIANDMDGKVDETIAEALAEAGRIAMGYFRKPVPVDIKSDSTPVTLADREAESAIRAIIAARFPEHGILGEEEGHSTGVDATWVIDPIDGTKSFMLGNPLFGCLVAFVRDEVVEAGGLAMPALGETWLARRGGGTTLNSQCCRTTGCKALKDADVLTSSPDFFNSDEAKSFDRLSERTRFRRFGGDCYTYAMVAGGWADIVVECGLHAFDVLALVPLVEEAGGRMTDWRGRPLGLTAKQQVIAAATPELHAAALAVLNER